MILSSKVYFSCQFTVCRDTQAFKQILRKLFYNSKCNIGERTVLNRFHFRLNEEIEKSYNSEAGRIEYSASGTVLHHILFSARHRNSWDIYIFPSLNSESPLSKAFFLTCTSGGPSRVLLRSLVRSVMARQTPAASNIGGRGGDEQVLPTSAFLSCAHMEHGSSSGVV